MMMNTLHEDDDVSSSSSRVLADHHHHLAAEGEDDVSAHDPSDRRPPSASPQIAGIISSRSGQTTSSSSAPAPAAAAATKSATAPPPQQQQQQLPPASAKRMYRSSRAAAGGGSTNQWVTRDIAALDFLLGIPLEAEPEIVHSGCVLLHQQRQLYSDEDHSSSKNENDSTTNESHSVVVAAAQPLHQKQEESINKQKQQQQQQQQQQQPKNKKLKWWEKWVQSNHPSAVSSSAGQSSSGGDDNNNINSGVSNKESSDQLEQPTRADKEIVAAAGTVTQSSVMLVEGGGIINSTITTTTTTTPSRNNNAATAAAASGYTALPYNVAPPGRRLEGDMAARVQIPLTTNTITRQKSIARQAAVREWEINTAHGLLQSSQQPATPMLDGRLFFSASGSYPLSVFSMIRYEPRKEEAALRRQKLEARGGGGSQYILPSRDWRGISYRALLPRSRAVEKENKAFNRFLKREKGHSRASEDKDGSKDYDKDSEGGGNDDVSSTSSSSVSSEDSDVYVPGLLDDPEMVLGRHRNVMIGDSVTGPIVASTIMFVEPALLKLSLNKQFRERFDGWEPPKSARKYIGAKVVPEKGLYVLMDPTDDEVSYERPTARPRQGSVASVGSASEQGGQPKEKQLRMPPSLTLSKIRSLKNQALDASLKAKLEIGTVALACVYFERLSLDCRVDKSNRRLSFAACLLLATKLNEPNSRLVMQTEETKSSSADDKNKMTTRLQALVRPNRRSNTMFAALLEFFTQEWNLSLKNLFDAEWGVFAALGFSLLATPSQVSFHFKRLMKTLEWNPVTYLGDEMYNQWQTALKDEEERRKQKERRREARRQRKQEQLLNLRLEIETDLMQRKNQDGGLDGDNGDDHLASDRDNAEHPDSPKLTISAAHNRSSEDSPSKILKAASGIKLFNRFGMRRSASRDRISQSEHRQLPDIPIYHHGRSDGNHQQHNRTQGSIKRGKAAAFAGLSTSPSMPVIASETGGIFAIDIPDQRGSKSETSSIDSGNISDQDGIFV